MKLEQYKPTGHNLVVEPIIESELKQGHLYLPPSMQRENTGVLAKVLKVGPLCEGITIGQLVILENTVYAKELIFEDHVARQALSVNQHIVLGIFEQ
jgi:hypothetical protein